MPSWYGGNNYLSMEQMTANAQYILDYLTAAGWTKNAICGVLGNLETESTVNPQLWQSLDYGNTSLGYGLVQWTPATNLINWCVANTLDYTLMDSQLQRILYEVEHNEQWIYSAMTFQEFTQSTDTPYNLAMLFLSKYERPANPNQPIRGTQAEAWYTTLTGGGSGGGTGDCKLIYPYSFGSNTKISYLQNRFTKLSQHGNAVRIQNVLSGRKYYVNKSHIKTI